jgi:phosphoglycolate phosphatase-like HAD superfamily hydrolase
MRALVLFDIDGTLLTSAAAGREAIRTAFGETFGTPDLFDSVRFDGKTDPQIVRELCLAAGMPERATDASIAGLLDCYLTHLERELAARRALVRALPGVPALLDALDATGEACVGLLTGNVVPGARLKLGAADIDFDRFRVGAFGSDSAHRPDLPPIAVERATPLLGRIPTGREIVIIGDTPADVTCGAAVGARAVGVATGSYTEAELHEAGAHVTFATLEDTAGAVDAILCLNWN